MKTIISSIQLIIILLLAQNTLAQIGTGNKDSYQFEHAGAIRSYNIYKPLIYTGNVKVPLVLILHPGVVQSGDTMNVQMERYTHFDLIADTAGFIICYPNARKGAFSDPDWAFWDHDGSFGWDDIGFLNQMMDNIITDYNIDTTKIYITGFSTGAYESYSMACTSGKRLAAIAPVSGHKKHSFECSPNSPVPIFHIHGDQDEDAMYFGNISQDFDSVATVLRIWYNYNNCNSTPIITQIPNVNTNDHTSITKYYYEPVSSDNEVIHYRVNNGGHGWPGASFSHPSEMGFNNMDIDASIEIWNFFRKHNRINNNMGLSNTISEINNIIVFPNPFENKNINIISNEIINQWVIYNEIGMPIIYSKNINSKTIEINSNNLSSGIYYIKIITKSNQAIVRKIISINKK